MSSVKGTEEKKNLKFLSSMSNTFMRLSSKKKRNLTRQKNIVVCNNLTTILNSKQVNDLKYYPRRQSYFEANIESINI